MIYTWGEFLKQFDNEMWLSYAHNRDKTIQDHTLIGSKFRLGYPPVTEPEIENLEKKLELALPDSYKSFLLQTNGWQLFGYVVEKILPVSEVDWFHKEHQDWTNIIKKYYPDKKGNINLVSPKNSMILYRKATNLDKMIQISSVQDTHVLLLDTSQRQTSPTLEYEVWSIEREVMNIYDNFWEAFQQEHITNIATNNILKRK
jgi:hypothetical protein